MDSHHTRARPARGPLLLNFVRPQPVSDLSFHYDARRRLNVMAHDGTPVVATAGGRAMLKSQGQVAED
jgi:hypothetical protein